MGSGKKIQYMSLFGLFHSEISIVVTVIVDFLFPLFSPHRLFNLTVCVGQSGEAPASK